MFSVLHCLMALLQTDDDLGPLLKRLDEEQELVDLESAGLCISRTVLLTLEVLAVVGNASSP